MVNRHSPSISSSLSPYIIERDPRPYPNTGAKVSVADDYAMVKGRTKMEV